MPQFMSRELIGVQTSLQTCFFDQSVYCRNADPVAVPRANQRPIVCKNLLFPSHQIIVQRISTGGSEVNESFLIAFANYTDTGSPKTGDTIGRWVAVLAVSSAGLAILPKKRRQ